ncbi:MAG: hypothetical protein WC852_04030 [Candidatus Nanoarchaeia archaeon]|jgi:RNA processing factor Prp31
MDLKKARLEYIEETKLRLLEEDRDRDAIVLFRSYKQIEQSIVSLKAVAADTENEIKNLENLKQDIFQQLSSAINSLMPETSKAAGIILSAKLLEKAGSLKKLSDMPSSKIQILGAEKALFRHLKEKTKSPKYGMIHMHESVEKSYNGGKAARKLASEIMKAARIDYYRK